MKNKYLYILSLCMLMFCSCAVQKANRQTLDMRYEIEATEGQAIQGNVFVKVYTYSKDKNVAMAQAGKNAVHGVLFKGTAPVNNAKVRIPGQKPIITDFNAEVIHKQYFESFFKEGGKYQKFIQVVNNGVPEPGDIIKVGKEYKVGVKVLVSKDALRKEMEAAGIIRKLGDGF